MISNRNSIVFICTVFVVSQVALFSTAFVLQHHYYPGYMGGNNYICNWGYSYCSHYSPEYYYPAWDDGCACGCDYGPGEIIPCDPVVPSVPESPKTTTEEDNSIGLSEKPPEDAEGEDEEEAKEPTIEEDIENDKDHKGEEDEREEGNGDEEEENGEEDDYGDEDEDE